MKTTAKLALARANYSQLYGVYDGGKTYRARDILTPYHLLTLAGYVRNHGAEVRIFDSEPNLSTEQELAESIINWKPHFVGLSATTPDIGLTIEVCRIIKDYEPSIVTIIGGPHATALPEDIARHKCVDYVVSGDGEQALERIIELERYRVRGEFKGDSQKERSIGDKIIFGKRQDIAKQNMPAHDLINYSNYKFTDPTRGQLNTASVMYSRGCPFNCLFCFHDRYMRFRNVDDFISEIEYLYKEKNVRYYYIYDDTFMADKRRAMEIVEKIKLLGIKDANFQCLTRAELVEPYLIEALRGANFVRVSMGLESGSDKILKAISKGVTKKNYITACKILFQAGVETRSSFILGLPYETRETILETIGFSKELSLLHANFNIMTPYPGTKVYEMALKGDGIKFSKPEYANDWSLYRRWGKAIIETDDLKSSDIEFFQKMAQVEFYSQQNVYNYYQSLFERGNRSRYFYRPLNFAWQKKFKKNIPFWDALDETEMVDPKK